MFEWLKELSNLIAPTGGEQNILKWLKAKLEELNTQVMITSDKRGNIFVEKGESDILITAHVDEVGIMITERVDNNYYRFTALGIPEQFLPAKRIIFTDNKRGVISIPPPHLKVKGPQSISDMYIFAFDELYPGDLGTFDTTFKYLSGGKIMGKAFDNRIGTYLSLKALFDPDIKNISVLFAVGEEGGHIGIKGALKKYRKSLVIALEGTAASDIPSLKAQRHVLSLNSGPVITIADRGIIVNNKLLEGIIEVAKESFIPYQFKEIFIGGTDAGPYQASGIPSAVISVPVRYIHSPVGIATIEDIQNTYRLVKGFILKHYNFRR